MTQRLVLRRGTVTRVLSEGPMAELEVETGGETRRAVASTALVGPVVAGDDVVVNVQAERLGLGSGGFDLVHVNLTRGLAGEGVPGEHVMKLNYSSLQHAVPPVEEGAGELQRPLGSPVCVIGLHGQLPCVAWAAAERAGTGRIGFVQGPGGALDGALSNVVRSLRSRGLLAGHVTAGSCFGGEHEAISVAGGVHAGLTALGWDGAIVGPGPGILGSATALGHGGLAALDAAHAALALGCRTLVCPRMSSGDPRPRHRGLSHHTRTVLEMLLGPVDVALPEGEDVDLPGEHRACPGVADLDGYLAAGLPARTMGRGAEEDELFFRSALAAGSALGAALEEGGGG